MSRARGFPYNPPQLGAGGPGDDRVGSPEQPCPPLMNRSVCVPPPPPTLRSLRTIVPRCSAIWASSRPTRKRRCGPQPPHTCVTLSRLMSTSGGWRKRLGRPPSSAVPVRRSIDPSAPPPGFRGARARTRSDCSQRLRGTGLAAARRRRRTDAGRPGRVGQAGHPADRLARLGPGPSALRAPGFRGDE